jgi:hypothetical protein
MILTYPKDPCKEKHYIQLVHEAAYSVYNPNPQAVPTPLTEIFPEATKLKDYEAFASWFTKYQQDWISYAQQTRNVRLHSVYSYLVQQYTEHLLAF